MSAECSIMIQMPLGLYIAVPFCRTKCTYCNFASDVFSRAVFDNYVKRLSTEIKQSPENGNYIGASLERDVDSLYFGGGTPTLLNVAQLEQVFVTIRQIFEVENNAEITMECAPGTLSDEMLGALVRCGVNRVSLGVQSFIDKEAASVGRLHKRETVLDDIGKLRAAGIPNISVDLIAGLPHQTRQSWQQSVDLLISTGVPHASVYMLEVDDDSRLGRELIAGGQKYHAHFVPNEDLTADLYEMACDRLDAAGIQQYEISNFARPGFASRHNLKYWTRQPYLGFGVDAHSMLPRRECEAVRFSNPDSLERYLACDPPTQMKVDDAGAIEETFFLGLRLNQGVDLGLLSREFGTERADRFASVIEDLIGEGLVHREGERIRLSRSGRLLSNEVFQRFISVTT